MSVWYAGAEALIRKALTFHSTYVTAGMSAEYYITDIFSGQYLIPGVSYDIQQQKSHYSFNPQQYYGLIGFGFLPSHSEERIYSAEFMARIPFSNIFYGRTQQDYALSGVQPVKLWSVSLTLTMELPFGKPITRERNDDRPAESGQTDSIQVQPTTQP